MTSKPRSSPPIVASADTARTLRQRAQALARPPEAAPGSDPAIELLEFRLANERYAFETRYVREVYPLKNLTPLPGTPSFVLGVINIRGRVVPVYDIKKFFDLPEQGLTDLHRVILVSSGELELGFLADVVIGVRSIPVESVQLPLPTLTGIRAEYVRGVTGERVVVLNVASMLADPKILVNEEVPT